MHYNRDHTRATMSIYVCSSTWEDLLYLYRRNLLLEGSQMSPKAANVSTVTCLHVCMYICVMCEGLHMVTMQGYFVQHAAKV